MARPSGLNIAVTGATGFIGRHLTEHLIAQGHTVTALVRSAQAPLSIGCRRILGGLDSDQALIELVTQQDAVIHLAGAVAAHRDADFFRVNAAGTTRLLSHIEAQASARLILVSSLAARHPELSPYAASKAAAEAVVKSSPLDWLIVRPPAVYGPGDPALAPLWALLARGWLPRLGSADARFAMIHVSDLVRGLTSMLALEDPQRRCVELDDGSVDGYNWADVADVAGKLRGRRVRTVPVPSWVVHSAARVTQWTQAWQRQPAMLSPGKARELRHTDWRIRPAYRYQHPTWSPQLDLVSGLRTLRGW